ncbi:ATP-binding protein [Vibrio parahaemolyticus]|nr:ATP-binding protein [Vibrio parahaemolyticus]EGQ9495240.1 ATP-binding protein [Vibrio parahaemolyticus]EGQ9504604.1 ATP-binding protein [Vibrio parahaemolyticus]EGQ9809584.1 ATP-binding protein [Vibrio parahaemolyticus]EGR0041186.1 ATP-binding protein [Vibrio parahaemolyticus]
MINIHHAEYAAPEIDDYQDQPLINALPLLNSPQNTAKELNRYPKVRDSEKTLPGYIRRHAMMRILDGFLYPTKAHLQLEQMISGMIRRGCLGRNIASTDYQRNLLDVDNVDFSAASRNAGSAALATTIIGCSGTGKTTAVQAILDSYKHQAIYHPEYQHIQLVWLKIDCPHDGSAKSLCIHFFRAVDDAIGSDYEILYAKSRSSAESMLGDIARVCALHSIGILVIDEIQHLNAARSGGATKLLNFFVTLTNVIKVPVLFIGTPKALDLFSPTMRSARRASQFGSLNWNRFEHLAKNGKESEWDRFIKRLWKLQWFKSPTPLTTPMKELFWELTQGVAHVTVSLFYLCQARAVVAGKESITFKLVNDVFNEELSIIHPMIKALQSGRKAEIVKYADLDLPADAVRIIGKAGDSDLDELEVTTETSNDKLVELTDMLTRMGLGEDVAKLAARQAIDEKPDEDLFGLVAHIKFLEDKPVSKRGTEKTKVVQLESHFIENDLRLLRSDEPMSTYTHLKKEGMILDIMPYL